MRVPFASWLDLLFPPACFRCDRSVETATALCPPCLASCPPPDVPNPPGLDRCVAGAGYDGQVEAWVRAFKYPGSFALPDPAPPAILGGLLLRAAESLGESLPDRIVPIPLHRRRLRQRGFNPAGSLARVLARRLDVPFDPVALRRTRDTPSQTGLDLRDRRRNVANAFAVVRPGQAPRRVWLVDDVVTTGATLSSAARALRARGSREVVALCAAATPRGRPASRGPR